MLYTEEQQVPQILLQMTIPGMASRTILGLVKMLLKRLNTPALNASVYEFNGVCGGPFPPSLRVLEVSAVDNMKGNAAYITIDFFRTCMENNAMKAPTSPAELSDLYDKVEFVARVDGDAVHRTGRQLEQFILNRIYGRKGAKGHEK